VCVYYYSLMNVWNRGRPDPFFKDSAESETTAVVLDQNLTKTE